jgi:urea transport system permease protein
VIANEFAASQARWGPTRWLAAVLLNGRCWPVLVAVLFVCLVASVHAAEGRNDEFIAAVAQFADSSFRNKEDAVGKLVQMRHPNGRVLLTALLEGRAFYRRDDRKVFIAAEDSEQLALTDPITMTSAGTAPRDDFSKITTNNRLRKVLKGAIAGYELSDLDVNVRMAAVKELMRTLDDDTAALLRDRLKDETDRHVRAAMQTGLSLADLRSEDPKMRLAGVKALQGNVNPDVYNALAALTEQAPDGSYAEPDKEVRFAAQSAMRSIEAWRSYYSVLETLFFGLSLGAVLVLAAIGLAITFGVMGVINMAHGELIMLGAYTAYVTQLLMPNHIDWSVLVAIPAAFVVSGAVGIAIERGIVRFLYGRPLETLLATFGVSLLLQQVVRDVFSANNRPVETPSWMSGSLQINDAFSITYNRLYVVLFTLAVFVLIMILLRKTTLGLKVRAVSQNRPMARAMGVRAEWIDALTFGLGSGIAGVAGVALSQITNVGPNLGQSYIVDSFMVVVFGGVGNLWGTLIGGMSLGVVNKVLEPYSGAVLAKILVLLALILFIQRRPRGLFPQKGRAAES